MIFEKLKGKPVSIFLEHLKANFTPIRGILSDAGETTGWITLTPWDKSNPLNTVTMCVQVPTFIPKSCIVMAQELETTNVEDIAKGITTVGR